MSRLLTAKEICERALRRIGTFPITEPAADPGELAEALHWLDMMIGHKAGSEDVLWLVPETLTLTLLPGSNDYLFTVLTPAEAVADGICFFVEARIEDAGGNSRPVKIVDRQAWEAISDPDREGVPEIVYIDRLKDGHIRTYPTLPAAETESWAVRLVAQTYAQDFTKNNGNATVAMRASWNLWSVTELSGLIGDGPVRALPDLKVQQIKKEAAKYWNDIFAGDNREHANHPAQVEPYDI